MSGTISSVTDLSGTSTTIIPPTGSPLPDTQIPEEGNGATLGKGSGDTPATSSSEFGTSLGSSTLTTTPTSTNTPTTAGNGVTTTTSIPPGPTQLDYKVKSNVGLQAATGVLAALFALALAAAIFLFIKRRQDKRRAYLSPAYSNPETGGYSDKAANAQIESLQTQLADANKRLTAVQGSLLAVGQKPPTKDDNTLSREYGQIGTDIVGWASNYFKTSNEQINLTSELYEFLTEHVPSYQSLITSSKSKQLVVRAIVCEVLQESFENNAFFGNTMTAIAPLVGQSTASQSAINSWRSETFFIIEKSTDFDSQRRAAVSTITDKIEQLTYPLAASHQTFQGDANRYKFLEGIVRRASDFAVSLGKQRANFQVLSEPAGCEFGHVTMDDVSQQTDVVTNSDGTTTHPLEGRPIQATIFPLLMKYGNEAGEGFEQVTILSKAKVLV